MTTPGFRTAPQCAHAAAAAAREHAPPRSSAPHARHSRSRIEPCTSITSREPARGVQPVDVLRDHRPHEARVLELARARGARRSAPRRRARRAAARRTPRRFAGSRRNASIDATSIRVVLAQIPLALAEVGDPALGDDARARQHDARLMSRGSVLRAWPRSCTGLQFLNRRSRSASRRPTRRGSRTTRTTSSGSRSRASSTSSATRAATSGYATLARGARARVARRYLQPAVSTTGSSCTRAASTCAAPASATSTRSSARDELIADGWTAHATVDARRCARRVCRHGSPRRSLAAEASSSASSSAPVVVVVGRRRRRRLRLRLRLLRPDADDLRLGAVARVPRRVVQQLAVGA